MKRILFLCFISMFSFFSVCFAQNWSSESDINNYYNNQINEIKRKIDEANRQLEAAISERATDPTRGMTDASERILELKYEIGDLNHKLEGIGAKRSVAIENFRQVQKAKQDAARKQQQEQDRIKKEKEEQQREKREKQEQIKKEKEEQDLKERERIFQQELARQKAINAPALTRDFNRYDQNKRNIEEAKQMEFSGIVDKHSRSGFVPASSEKKTVRVASHNSKETLANKYLQNKGKIGNVEQGSNWLEEFDY